MKIRNLKNVLICLIALAFFGCDSKPRVIESDASTQEAGALSAMEEASAPLVPDAISDEHKVVAEEALNTEKYTYLRVTENDEDFWIAIAKRDIEIGETYYYKGGLLKQNFFSREFNRVFETVYLVSNIWKHPSGDDSALDEAFAQLQPDELPDLEVGNIEPAAGAIKISDLFANKQKYGNQVVKVTGKCVKVNPMIMNRNWVHIQDDSTEEMDLTVTTAENIPLGAVVTLEGTIALDKDFGAGYRYEVIMEGAVLR